ncbi:penicillin-binding protein 1A [Anabaena cylindrica FACHB-243]|uniref:Penicillin-binding protein, 1A family n=1 Tax=Anabaena cylindrica (strain ATCC 27899 / PCC 7122) TaxID=272123 RepID=K9ZMJ0_ANACC|nr:MULTISPECIES: penicillin-binding protein 1A [Anabaena]AFZ59742.1 penicillin-binding protein, 1A family [Anabaena cylindrica PCC 7122]MBD2417147.1 penicillin-binding protein 1A [Anabaena cylindrica FACHB-243]MCM2405037.1 penicillin-binding protein 1A [Anabaena sp. CCAP 1446/1C]BAY03208.1 1A family penicillin-binding protein [Anabaena cylindrica PCC 7122]
MLVKAKQLLNQMTSISSVMIARIGKSDKPFYRRLWFWVGLSVGGGIVAFNYGLRTIDSSLPDKSKLNAVLREQTLTIKAGDGTVLQQQGEATREQLKLEQIPDRLKKAFIASEDRRFEQHQGVDTQGILRAVVNNVRSQNVVEGGSTITQQVARILFLTQERTIWRKLKEVRLAQKMERELTKNEILERYLNLVYLGSGAYGVGDAAWVYFSKTVDQLTLSEMATIAGLAPAPNVYAPDKNPKAAIERRNQVLQRMQEDQVITPTEQQTALQEPLTVNSNLPKRFQVEFPYFTIYVQQELPKYISADLLAAGGLVVETSLNPTWQKAAEAAVAKTLKNQGRWENFKEAALVAIDPRNGEIQAMVGGKDFSNNQFNRVTQAQRQPGSTFKGFVYAAAIATGKNPYDSYLDAPLVVDGYEPKNYSKKFYGWMNLRDALTRSINTIAVKVLIDVGYEPTIKLAQDMGIKSELKSTYSLALGSNEVNLLELTSAYGSFATQGLHTDVHGIRRILNRQGEVIWSADFQPKQSLDTDSAAIMTWMLRNVVRNGTGAAAQLNDRQVAGKTGTSDESRDLWFIGYIPQLVTGVWLGNDNNRPTYGSSSSAAYTWHEFMEKAVEGMSVEKFPERPKLEGRKATIKAQPIKPHKIINRSISDNNEESDRNDDSSSRRRKRNTQVEEQQSDYTPRRRRRYKQQEENTTSRKQRSQESSGNSSGSSRSQRRNSGSDSGSSRSSAPASRGSSESSSPKGSWRERLKPNSSAE